MRFLDEELLAAVKGTINAMPLMTTRAQAAHACARWLFLLLFLCGLRISEVVGNAMGDFFCRADKSGELRRWLAITGKGEKLRLVPVTNELMVELAHDRRSLGLPRLSQEHECMPLLLSVWWREPARTGATSAMPAPRTRAAAHEIVKAVFEQAQLLEAQGKACSARAQRRHIGCDTRPHRG